MLELVNLSPIHSIVELNMTRNQGIELQNEFNSRYTDLCHPDVKTKNRFIVYLKRMCIK